MERDVLRSVALCVKEARRGLSARLNSTSLPGYSAATLEVLDEGLLAVPVVRVVLPVGPRLRIWRRPRPGATG
jgi:hypothetical protein